MYCPYCAHIETSVIESRLTRLPKSGIRRRRECLNCQKRFTTYEYVGNIDLKVIKRSGDKENFDRDKLKKGILKACWKRGIDEHEVDEIVNQIEMKLLNGKTVSVASKNIGKMVLTRLKKIDGIAYLRFASVYKEFETLEDFANVIYELQNLKERRKNGHFSDRVSGNQ
jgi:transcriptional repressor NrdR